MMPNLYQHYGYQPQISVQNSTSIPTYNPYLSNSTSFAHFYDSQPTYLENTEPITDLRQENDHIPEVTKDSYQFLFILLMKNILLCSSYLRFPRRAAILRLLKVMKVRTKV